MKLDRWIALLFLVVSIVYGVAAYQYPLLPFERNMAFKPNTMPMALSALGALLSLIILLSPESKQAAEPADKKPAEEGAFSRDKYIQAGLLLGAMVLYALALRPIGFIIATSTFLVASGWILGERKPVIMIGIALVGSVSIWAIVQQGLGIFLRPLPWFLS